MTVSVERDETRAPLPNLGARLGFGGRARRVTRIVTSCQSSAKVIVKHGWQLEAAERFTVWKTLICGPYIVRIWDFVCYFEVWMFLLELF